MKKIIYFILLLALPLCAQNSERFYATMNIVDAKALKADIPDQIDIIATKQNEAAVYMSENAAHKLHDRILVHGPGYVFKASETEALTDLHKNRSPIENRMPLTITEDAWVASVLEVIDTQNIEDQIIELQNYGTRYHDTPSAIQSAQDLKTKWEAMAAAYNRSDVSVRLYNHASTNMPSVIMTIEGAELPDEFVIVGGHLDSTSNQGNNNAPGADDDASGIATITEATRALFEIGFVPKRTIEVMAYAAEEIGLVGSAEIAQEYANNNINVAAVVQFDMTNFNGSGNDVSFITDFTNATLNTYLMQLLDYYNNDGPHEVTYSTSLCNYGCSDHASWTAEGFMASFPFEASFGQHNGNIHTANDTFSVSGTADHAAKFAKLCAEFFIEVAKSSVVLGVSDEVTSSIFATIDVDEFLFDLGANERSFQEISLVDLLGKKVLHHTITDAKGRVSVAELASGVYIATFKRANGNSVTKKVLKE